MINLFCYCILLYEELTKKRSNQKSANCCFCDKLCLKIYSKIVRSIFGYACQVWSSYHKYLIDMLETIQRGAIRYIFILGQLESVTSCTREHAIDLLVARRLESDKKII